jgi:hypothetical protein
MRYWIRTEPVSDSLEAVHHIMSEGAIIAEYWTYWCSQMTKTGKQDMISAERCIEDWAAVHWAAPVTRENLEKFLAAPNGQ